MTSEIVEALLWRARAALRVDGVPLFAGHGLADPLYRPPRLPYASILGPLSYAVEPERDLPRNNVLVVRTPGYLAGAPLDGASVPPPGDVALVLDGDVRVTLALDHGTDEGQLVTAPRGRALADRMQAAFDAALAAGVTDLEDVPVDDPERLAELARTTVRWDEAHFRIVIASGRRGPVAVERVGTTSSVRLATDAVTDHASALGLADGDPLADPPVPGAISPAGRIVRHQVPAPIAMSFDVRVDLWAGSQRHLAALVEAWARVTPTRCQVLLRPALLAADVAPGATEIPLQRGGEPPTRWTLTQLEPQGGFADRRTGEAVRVTNGAAAEAAGLRLPPDGRATLRLLPQPAIPDPFAPPHPAPGGWALATQVRVEPGPPAPAAGDRLLLAEFEHGGRVALRLELVWVVANGATQTRVEAMAEAADGTALGPATVDVDPAALDRGAELHALVDAVQGQVAVFAEGRVAVGVAAGPVTVPGGEQMLLRIGAAGAPAEVVIGHVQVFSRPLGPLDHRHRQATATADRWRAGDPVTLTRTDDGFTPRGRPFSATVVDVTDGALRLDRPVVGIWSRHDTLVGSRIVFSQQTQVRRRDDMASNLARMSLSHTISGFVDPHDAGTSARLVEAIDLQVRDYSRSRIDVPAAADEAGDADGDGGRPRPAATVPSGRRYDGAPTVEGRIVPARVLQVHRPEDTEPPGAQDIERAPEAPRPQTDQPVEPA